MQFVHCKGLTKYGQTVYANCVVQSMCKIQTKSSIENDFVCILHID